MYLTKIKCTLYGINNVFVHKDEKDTFFSTKKQKKKEMIKFYRVVKKWGFSHYVIINF